MPGASSHEITELLQAWSEGEEKALDKLAPLVYAELHRLAHFYMTGERTDHTLQTTALVNEAYLKLVDSSRVQWQNRVHFFAVSARLMRRILVDFARSRNYVKRGAGAQRLSLEEAPSIAVERSAELLALDEALTALGAVDARKGRLVELRYFGGLTEAEAAAALNVSEETVKRDWRLAKVWLRRELSREAGA